MTGVSFPAQRRSDSLATFYPRDATRPVLYNESEEEGAFRYDVKGNYTELASESALRSELRPGETVSPGEGRRVLGLWVEGFLLCR